MCASLLCLQLSVQRNSLMQDYLASADGSVLPAKLTTLLASAPVDCHSAMTATLAINMFLGLFTDLNDYSTLSLGHSLSLNKAGANASSSVIRQWLRPDTVLVANSCLLLGMLACA